MPFIIGLPISHIFTVFHMNTVNGHHLTLQILLPDHLPHGLGNITLSSPEESVPRAAAPCPLICRIDAAARFISVYPGFSCRASPK